MISKLSLWTKQLLGLSIKTVIHIKSSNIYPEYLDQIQIDIEDIFNGYIFHLISSTPGSWLLEFSNSIDIGIIKERIKPYKTLEPEFGDTVLSFYILSKNREGTSQTLHTRWKIGYGIRKYWNE